MIDNPVAFCVIVMLHLMDPAVNFNNQAHGMAVKINDKSIDYLLAAEVESKSVATQVMPKDFFFGRHLPPKFSGTFFFLRIDFLADDYFIRTHET